MRRQKQSKSREKRSIEPGETEYMSREKQNQEARGEISRCIEYTGWLYIAEKAQTSRDFHKKKCRRNGTEGGLLTTNNTKQHLFYDFTGWLKDDEEGNPR